MKRHLLILASLLQLALSTPAVTQHVPPQQPDPLLERVPTSVATACATLLPGYRALRVIHRDRDSASSHYIITLFDPLSTATKGLPSAPHEATMELALVEIEVAANGLLVREASHSVPDSQVPKTVLARFRSWARPVSGFGPMWSVEKRSGYPRTFTVIIGFTQVKKGFLAIYREDGTVVREDRLPTR